MWLRQSNAVLFELAYQQTSKRVRVEKMGAPKEATHDRHQHFSFADDADRKEGFSDFFGLSTSSNQMQK